MKLFAGLALLAFTLATFGADVVSRVLLGGGDFGPVASEHLYYAAVQPVGTVMLLTPFAVLALLCIWVSRRTGLRRAMGLFLTTSALLFGLYFLGYEGARTAYAEEQWTAGALSVGLLPVFAVPVLLGAAIAGLILSRVGRRPATAGEV